MTAGLDVGALEDVAFRAVPAAEVHDVGGWRLRCTPDLHTRRANSVLARASVAEFESAVGETERFYADRGRPARFQVTPASQPGGLRERLRDRGYAPESATCVQTAAVTELVAGGGDPPGTTVALADAPGERWWATWGEALQVPPARAAGAAGLFARIAVPRAFAVVHLDGEPVGVGLGVADDGWVGIFNMATRPDARRHGAARSALRALAHWGGARGAARAYLQVEAANDRARALYRGAGFADAYEYAYLTRTLSGA